MVSLPKLSSLALMSALVTIDSTEGFHLAQQTSCRQDTALAASRRSVVENLVLSSMATVFIATDRAEASGGATAGGAYLLSAKQRYNDRVKAGVKGFLSLGPALESGDIETIRSYYNGEDLGQYKDLTTAGYLLANAFRRNSTAAPDSLPSVKKWKAFVAQVDMMAKAIKKKDMAGALSVFRDSAVPALDEYLTQVELPSAKELGAS